MCVCVCVCVGVYTGHGQILQVHLFFTQICHSFQKVKPIYYIDALHIEWNISSLYFLTFWWLWLTDNEKTKFSGWASFCMNYCINAAWHGGDQPVALLRCNEAQAALIVAFRSSALLGLVSLIFLLTIPSRFSMVSRSGEFALQSSTVTPWSLNQLFVPLAVWAGAKSCWKMKLASP